MNTNARSFMIYNRLSLTSFLFAALTLSACDSADVEYDNTSFRSGGWSKVTCTLGDSDRCYAKTSASPELPHPVTSWCDLSERVGSGALVPTTGGWFYNCDQNGRPESFDDVLCFYDSATHVTCYGGSDGWYTEVTPTCAPDVFTEDAWVAAGCSLDLDPGPHEYDTVTIDPHGPTWLAQATIGDDAVTVIQECAMPSGGVAAADPFACDAGELPCCSCSGDYLMCEAFAYDHVCPTGKSTTVMTCVDDGFGGD